MVFMKVEMIKKNLAAASTVPILLWKGNPTPGGGRGWLSHLLCVAAH
jgi:hypothetical protein